MQPKWRISHARGYLELGMVEEAAAELAAVPAEAAETLEVLGLQALVFQEQKKWAHLRVVTHKLVRMAPDDAGWWIMWAYAVRRSDSLEAAEKILHEAEVLHPKDATIQFNLGCYACQLGNLTNAKNRVDRAIALNAAFQQMAASDPDLEPLRKKSDTA